MLPAVVIASLLARWWTAGPINSWLPQVEAVGLLLAGMKLFAALVIGRMDDFVLGAFLAELHWRGALERLLPCRWALLAVAGSVFAVAVPWRHEGWKWIGSSSPFLNTLVQAGALALLTAVLQWPRGVVRAVLWNPPLRIAGIMCYSIYVWHSPVLNVFLARTVSRDRFGIWAVLTLGLSVTTAVLVERVLPASRRTTSGPG